MENIIKDLISMSHALGIPERELAQAGEGNTSAAFDKYTFFLKASGFELGNITEADFVLLKRNVVISLLEKDNVSEDKLKEVFALAKVNQAEAKRPSVEALMHAICLSYEGVNFVGHTHPVYINQLTCSKSYPENLKGRMYPDEIVSLGIDSVYLPYTDPGVPLAKALKNHIDEYIKKYDEVPKSVYMQNHGFVALGKTKNEVEVITLTAQKAAKVRVGAMLAGGVNLLSDDTVLHIANRPDEKYRQNYFQSK